MVVAIYRWPLGAAYRRFAGARAVPHATRRSSQPPAIGVRARLLAQRATTSGNRAAEDGGASHEDITAEIGEDDATVLRARGDSVTSRPQYCAQSYYE